MSCRINFPMMPGKDGQKSGLRWQEGISEEGLTREKKSILVGRGARNEDFPLNFIHMYILGICVLGGNWWTLLMAVSAAFCS